MQYSLNPKLHHWLKVLHSPVTPLLEHALSSRVSQSQMPSSLGGSTSKEKKYLIIRILIYIQDFSFCLIIIIWLICAPRYNVVDPLYNRKLYQNWKHIIFATVAAWADLCPTYTHVSECVIPVNSAIWRSCRTESRHRFARESMLLVGGEHYEFRASPCLMVALSLSQSLLLPHAALPPLQLCTCSLSVRSLYISLPPSVFISLFLLSLPLPSIPPALLKNKTK